MRLLASRYARYGVTVERQGLGHSLSWVAAGCRGTFSGIKHQHMSASLHKQSFTLLTAPPACHLLTLTAFESQTKTLCV